MQLGLFGYLVILAGVAELVFGVCFFAFVKRLLGRAPKPLSEEIGGFRKVLRKLRKGEPMSDPYWPTPSQPQFSPSDASMCSATLNCVDPNPFGPISGCSPC